MLLPEMDVMLIVSLVDITAKLLTSLIESKYYLIAEITEVISIISSSSNADRVN